MTVTIKAQGPDGQLAGDDGEAHDQPGDSGRGKNARNFDGKTEDRSTVVQHDASVSSFTTQRADSLNT